MYVTVELGALDSSLLSLYITTTLITFYTLRVILNSMCPCKSHHPSMSDFPSGTSGSLSFNDIVQGGWLRYCKRWRRGLWLEKGSGDMFLVIPEKELGNEYIVVSSRPLLSLLFWFYHNKHIQWYHLHQWTSLLRHSFIGISYATRECTDNHRCTNSNLFYSRVGQISPRQRCPQINQ